MTIGIIVGTIITRYVEINGKWFYYLLGSVIIIATLLNIFDIRIPEQIISGFLF